MGKCQAMHGGLGNPHVPTNRAACIATTSPHKQCRAAAYDSSGKHAAAVRTTGNSSGSTSTTTDTGTTAVSTRAMWLCSACSGLAQGLKRQRANGRALRTVSGTHGSISIGGLSRRGQCRCRRRH